jgi:hypothetical protein
MPQGDIEEGTSLQMHQDPVHVNWLSMRRTNVVTASPMKDLVPSLCDLLSDQ